MIALRMTLCLISPSLSQCQLSLAEIMQESAKVPRLLLLLLLLLVPPLMAEHPEEGEVEHFKVFHVEWERVEVPYIVFVWILATIFVKLGQWGHIQTYCSSPY